MIPDKPEITGVPEVRSEKDRYQQFLRTIQPDEQKRKLVISSLDAFMSENSLSFNKITKANKILLVATVLRIGVQISRETVYPRMHDIGKSQIMIIQDNYLYLQKIILQHTGADNLVCDIIYNNEVEYLSGTVDNTFNKLDYVPIQHLNTTQQFEDVALIIIGLSGKNIVHNTFKTYTKAQLIERAGRAYSTGMIWKSGNHNRLEMLKKTAIRAFVKERYGGALEIIRTIDIGYSNLISQTG